jgi:hypothetical protein
MKYFVPNCIVVIATAKDQGWSSYPELQGTRIGSYTWGELSVETSSSNGSRYECYRNIHAGSNWEDHSAIYTRDSDFIKELISLVNSNNDKSFIRLWIRSQYPGWRHHILNATIYVTWQLHKQDLILIKA